MAILFLAQHCNLVILVVVGRTDGEGLLSVVVAVLLLLLLLLVVVVVVVVIMMSIGGIGHRSYGLDHQ